MENTKIKIIKEFREFALYKPIGVFKELERINKEINIFGSQVAICIVSDNLSDYIWFGIVGDIFNTKKIDVEIDNFNELYINNTIDLEYNKSGKYRVYFQNYLDRFYMMISSSRRSREAQSLAEDFYGNDILYIYGIWEVELSEDFKNEIFKNIEVIA